MIPVIPVGYAYSVELTYEQGISEATANGMMVLCSQIYGVILGISATYACELLPPPSALYLFIASSVIATVTSFTCLKEKKPNNILPSSD